jgi:transposase InsO family protein
MPWKESCIMEERLKFIVEARGGVAGIAELARAYGVSRKTAYKWLGRYEEAGAPGLLERSRAPHSMPWAVPEEVAALIVALRKRRPTWGPRKLLAALEGEQLGIKLPAASTVAELLSRRGLVVHRRRARRTPLYQGPFTACRAANQVWCADFKGHFLLGNHRVCHPLTITDAFSRYLLRCEGLSRTGEPDVRPQFDSAFREFGLPEAIRTDNGAPFATTAPAGLSKLASPRRTAGTSASTGRCSRRRPRPRRPPWRPNSGPSTTSASSTTTSDPTRRSGSIRRPRSTPPRPGAIPPS